MFGLTLIRTYELIFIGLIVLTTIFLWWKARTSEFYWNDFKHAFPLIGSISRAIRRKNINKDKSKYDLTPSELNLLHTYSDHINAIDRTRFNNAYTFLLLAKQADRSLPPIWANPIIFILVVAEALGFSFLLAPFIAAEITRYDSQIIGVVLAFVLAIIAAGLTHMAGGDLYTRGLINKMRRVADDQKVPIYKGSGEKNEPIKNDEDQSIDQGEHYATRFGNRVLGTSMDRGPKWWIVAAAVYITLVAGASTALRYENLHIELTKQSSVQSAGHAGGYNPFASMGSAASQSLPPAVQQSAQKANARVHAEETGERLIRGLAGIISLGVIFVFTQIFSISNGFRFGLIKNERVGLAYEHGTMGFSSYDDYEKYELDPKIRRAEMRLQKLRDGLFHDSGESPSSLTFREWLHEDQARRRAKRDADKKAAAAKEAEDRAAGKPNNGYTADLSSDRQVRPDSGASGSPVFDPDRLARDVLNIEDSTQRRKFIDDRTLTQEEMDQLKAAIFAEKSRRKAEAEKPAAPDTSWMDEL